MKDEGSARRSRIKGKRFNQVANASSFILHASAFILHASAFILHASAFILAFLALHRREKLRVGLGLFQSLQHHFHLFYGRQGIEHAAHHPDAAQILFAQE